jgi:Swt1-like HEPN
MAINNHERVGKAMELLKQGLAPFIEREFKNSYKERITVEALRYLGDDRNLLGTPIGQWDTAALLKLMWEAWNDVFRRTLGPAERSLVSELRDARNKWAHQQPFSSDDAYRALDSAGRLLTAVSAPQAAEIEKMKMELLRLRFDEQVRAEQRKNAGTAIEGAAASNLKPWREVVTPHKDVASGRYQQAEFAADLWQVHLAERGRTNIRTLPNSSAELISPRASSACLYVRCIASLVKAATLWCSSRLTSAEVKRTPCWRFIIFSRAQRQASWSVLTPYCNKQK